MPKAWPVPQAGPLDSTSGAQRDGIIIPSAEYSHTTDSGVVTSPAYANYAATGVRLYVDVTNIHTNGTVTVKIQTQDPASLNWVDVPLATTATLAAVATTTLTVYPSVAETSVTDISDPLGNMWRVVATVATAHVDFSVGGVYLE